MFQIRTLLSQYFSQRLHNILHILSTKYLLFDFIPSSVPSICRSNAEPPCPSTTVGKSLERSRRSRQTCLPVYFFAEDSPSTSSRFSVNFFSRLTPRITGCPPHSIICPKQTQFISPFFSRII